MTTSSKTSGRNLKAEIFIRAHLAFWLLALSSLAIIYRVFYIQQIDGDYWRKRGNEKQLTLKEIPATRGNIYAEDGQSLLATSLPSYRLIFDPLAADKELFYEKIDSLALLLSHEYQDKSAADYKSQLVSARRTGRIRYMLLNTKWLKFRSVKRMKKWPIFREGRFKGGAIFIKEERRDYPFKLLARRTLGYTDLKGGATGLEFSFNHFMAGTSGFSLVKMLKDGSYRPVYDESLPVDGADVVTTLDINIQDVAEAALEKALLHHKAKSGCVILMEVSTGKIKALVNLGPDGNGGYLEDFNYAVAERREPGSTMKLCSYLALFEEDKIEPDDSVNTKNGELKLYDRRVLDTKEGGYGKISFKDAFAKSSNVAIAQTLDEHFKNDKSKYLAYLDQFGLSQDLGFQLSGYAKPNVKSLDDKSWSLTTLPWMSMGYELEVSPLQTLSVYNAIANEGKMVRPYLVDRIMQGSKTIESFETEVIRKEICSDGSREKMLSLLEAVVESGTAVNVKHADYRIAGKTGTAQKLINGRYTQKYYTSFCGFFPADKPKYSCIVVIDEPMGPQQYAAEVSAPVFKEIADKIYSLDLEIHPEEIEKQASPQEGLPLIQAGLGSELKTLCDKLGISAYGEKTGFVRASRSNASVKLSPMVAAKGTVPPVQGMTLRDALFVLENKGYRVSWSGNGRVQNQSPKAYTPYGSKKTVYLNLN